MDTLTKVFAEARGYRDDAKRARRLAERAHGKLQNELLDIAALYDRLADGKGEPHEEHLPRDRPSGPLGGDQRAEISAQLAQLMLS
jgi:hypothetical protein